MKHFTQKQTTRPAHFCETVAEYLEQDKKRIIYNTFIMSDFDFCPLILDSLWEACQYINRVHKWALGIMLRDFTAPFGELLAKGS